jgi:hypothetical protein
MVWADLRKQASISSGMFVFGRYNWSQFHENPSHNILCLKISGRSLYYENLSHNYISGSYSITIHRVLCHGIDLMIFVCVNFELM